MVSSLLPPSLESGTGLPDVTRVRTLVLRYGGLALLCWSLLIGGSMLWNVAKQREVTNDLALATARSAFDKDLAYRTWASSHGGVYVEPTEKTPPSPWMAHLPDRDLTTTEGRVLTLMNPAYMLREMMQDYGDLYGIKGRLVGIVYLNPNNEADPWEADAIRQFSTGKVTEKLEVANMDGEPHLRLIKPFHMEQSCQKCHGHLGFKNGEVRGAVGVSVPMKPYYATESRAARAAAASHLALWSLGVVAILLMARRSTRRLTAAATLTLALHDSERYYRTIVETAVDGFWMADSQGRLLEVNQAYIDRSGYGREELLGMSIQDLEARESEQETLDHIARIAASGPDRFETRHRTKAGEVWDVEVSTAFFTGAQGRLFVFLRDITERKRAEAVLAESERRFREMAETIDQVFFVAEPDYSKFHYISPAFARLWRRDAAELMVHPHAWMNWVHAEDIHRVRSILVKGLGTGEYETDFRIVLPDGEVRWLHSKAFEVMREATGARQVVGFQADITAAKMAEEELRTKNQALERSNTELEAFAYVASHDLREPLRNVTAFSTMLARRLEGRLDADETEMLGMVSEGGRRMDALVRDLLDLSKVGRSERKQKPVKLGEVVDMAVRSLRAQLDSSGASLDVPDSLPTVNGEKEELYRVFLNIFGNCLKYRGDAPPVITVTCRADDGFWRLAVTDNGIGIETGRGYEERIFGLFQRLHHREEYGGGTGIGLPICRKIVERLGGRIWLESPGLGKGSTVFILLPVPPPSGRLF